MYMYISDVHVHLPPPHPYLLHYYYLYNRQQHNNVVMKGGIGAILAWFFYAAVGSISLPLS